MSKKITIDPVSRVEGHGKITIQLDDQGNAVASEFHVQEFRGFEKLCEGRMIWEMPVFTSRICGICPVSHHLAAVKATDALLGVQIPPAAAMLRELMHMAQFIHSHSLHFFYLTAPDLLIGPDAAPIERNIVGLISKDRELAQKAIRLRQIGQDMIERVGGRSIHPVTAIPGGMSKPLSHEDRYVMLKEIDEASALAQLALDTCKKLFEDYAGLVPAFGAIESKYMGLVKNDCLELYDGDIRLINAGGTTAEEFKASDYLEYIAEYTTDYTYNKFPYYRKEDREKGLYRVGPLARLNVSERIATPLANKEFMDFRELGKGLPVNDTMYYHYARVIEIIYAVERAKELLLDDTIVSRETRVPVKRQAGEGVGVIEAPRGTLIHHYWADDLGKVEKANIIVSTTHNNAAINKSVYEVAKTFIRGGEIQEGMLNRVEMVVRCYDPCLSCSTHQIGKMPLIIEVFSPEGRLVGSVRRDA